MSSRIASDRVSVSIIFSATILSQAGNASEGNPATDADPKDSSFAGVGSDGAPLKALAGSDVLRNVVWWMTNSHVKK